MRFLGRHITACLLSAALLSATGAARAQIVTLNQPDGFVRDAAVASNGSLVAAVWVEVTADTNRLLLSWGEPNLERPKALISALDAPPQDLALAVADDGLIHCIWSAESTTTRRRELLYTLATPGGDITTDLLASMAAPTYPSSPDLALGSDILASSLVWTQGSGSYRQVVAALQHGDGSSEEWILAGGDQPANYLYPQVFALADEELLFAWSKLGQESRIEGFKKSARDDEWIALSSAAISALPAERVPILVQDGPNSVGALYVDEGGSGSDAVFYQELSADAAPLALSGRIAGSARLPVAIFDGARGEAVAAWAIEADGEQIFEAARVGGGGVEPIQAAVLDDGGEALAAGVVAGDSQLGLSGLDLAITGDSLHLIWWATVESGGRGDLNYTVVRVVDDSSDSDAN